MWQFPARLSSDEKRISRYGHHEEKNIVMPLNSRYRGIFFMLLAALGFSLMGGSAKLLKGSFNAGQLVFFRNLVGAVGLTVSFITRPPVNKGGKFHWLVFRGFMGTIALYTLLYCVLHLPLSTA